METESTALKSLLELLYVEQSKMLHKVGGLMLIAKHMVILSKFKQLQVNTLTSVVSRSGNTKEQKRLLEKKKRSLNLLSQLGQVVERLLSQNQKFQEMIGFQ